MRQCQARPGLSSTEFRHHFRSSQTQAGWNRLAELTDALDFHASLTLKIDLNNEMMRERGSVEPFDALIEVRWDNGQQLMQKPEDLDRDRSTEPLIKALNGLFDLVSSRNKALFQLNQSLETQVAERTQALSEANAHLEETALTDTMPATRYCARSREPCATACIPTMSSAAVAETNSSRSARTPTRRGHARRQNDSQGRRRTARADR